MPELLLATRNAHKAAEVRAILGPAWQVTDLSLHPDWPEVEETGDTFSANAALKALAASRRAPEAWVLADDSGLEVDALGGAPGVRSARYAGPGADDAANRTKLLAALAEAGATAPARRSARFRCVLAVARGGGLEGEFAGAVEGTITAAEEGAGGFGYDPLFQPDGFDETFGTLPAATKNRLSHRALALAEAAAWLRRKAA